MKGPPGTGQRYLTGKKIEKLRKVDQAIGLVA